MTTSSPAPGVPCKLFLGKQATNCSKLATAPCRMRTNLRFRVFLTQLLVNRVVNLYEVMHFKRNSQGHSMMHRLCASSGQLDSHEDIEGACRLSAYAAEEVAWWLCWGANLNLVAANSPLSSLRAAMITLLATAPLVITQFDSRMQVLIARYIVGQIQVYSTQYWDGALYDIQIHMRMHTVHLTPALASRRVISWPMPLLAPVMTATDPTSNLPFMMSSPLVRLERAFPILGH